MEIWFGSIELDLVGHGKIDRSFVSRENLTSHGTKILVF